MSKTLNSMIETAKASSSVTPFFALDLMFDSQPLYLWTGLVSATIDGRTYSGAGPLLSIGEPSETADLSAVGLTLTLNGMSSDVVALATNEPYQGRLAYLKFGVVSDAGVPSETVTLWAGIMDQMTIDGNPEGAIITLAVESKMVELERPRIGRYTSESHKVRFPDDPSFEFVEALQSQSLAWGRKSDKTETTESTSGSFG